MKITHSQFILSINKDAFSTNLHSILNLVRAIAAIIVTERGRVTEVESSMLRLLFMNHCRGVNDTLTTPKVLLSVSCEIICEIMS